MLRRRSYREDPRYGLSKADKHAAEAEAHVVSPSALLICCRAVATCDDLSLLSRLTALGVVNASTTRVYAGVNPVPIRHTLYLDALRYIQLRKQTDGRETFINGPPLNERETRKVRHFVY